MMQEPLAEKLKDEIGTAAWPLLKPHADRGVLLMIHTQLDLLDVAVQVAEDQTEQVRSWLDSGKISRPPLAQMKAWEAENTVFTCVIVHPFVLIQLPA